MKLRTLTTAAALAFSAATACSGSDGGGPTGPAGAVATVDVTLADAAITVGGSTVPQAVAKDAEGRAVQATFTWTSSNTDIATVDADGRARGMTAGTATVTATASGIAGSADLQVLPRNLDAMAEAVRSATGLPAMAGAIVSSRGLIGIGVAGTRRASGGPAVTLDDKWHLGSNLKAITSALAAIAVDRGDIDWTTTIEQSFPELDGVMLDVYRDVTLESLLSHGGGIRNDPPGAAYAGTTAREQRESLVEWAVSSQPIGPVGSYYYSNTGYVIAGAMIERAMNGTYEELLATHLTGPLGVTGLGWGAAAGAGQSNEPVGHYLQGGAWVACEACDNPPGLSAAGRAHMRMGDWASIIQELLTADAGTSTMITPESGRKLFTGHTPLPPSTNSYGLGWVITNRTWANGRTATHDGSNTTNHSVAWLGLEPGIAFIAATNAADLTGGTTGDALDALIGQMLGLWQSTN